MGCSKPFSRAHVHAELCGHGGGQGSAAEAQGGRAQGGQGQEGQGILQVLSLTAAWSSSCQDLAWPPHTCMFSALGPELHAGKLPAQQHVEAQIFPKVLLNRAAYAIVSCASMHLPLALLCFLKQHTSCVCILLGWLVEVHDAPEVGWNTRTVGQHLTLPCKLTGVLCMHQRLDQHPD